MRLRRAPFVAIAAILTVVLSFGASPYTWSGPAVTDLGALLPPTGTQPRPPAQPLPSVPAPIVIGYDVRDYVSYYRYADPAFHGGCVAIRDAATWSAFWAVHVGETASDPEAPGIDFAMEIVLVCLLGFVSDCCGSYVNITEVERDADGYSVSVDSHGEYGILAMVTNPYHIRSVTRADGDVTFRQHRSGLPIPEIVLFP